jgi:putative membrane protein
MGTANEKFMVRLITVVSVLIPLAVFLLIKFPVQILEIDADLPLFHAVINGSTAIILLLAYWRIRVGDRETHKRLMLTSLGLSTIFLVSYVLSKLSNEPTPFGGEGAIRYIYFFILISHIILATTIVPLALFSIYRGLSGQFKKHRKVAKWTFPIWLYVAVTGVLVYLFMAPYYA